VLILLLFYFYSIAGVILFATNDPWHFKVGTDRLTLPGTSRERS
jgi:hypothetical protein